MSRTLSLNARIAQEAQESAEVDVVLVKITHADIPGGSLRVSSDPTEQISTEPVAYGTYSTWLTAGGEPFYWTVMDIITPDEKDDAPSEAMLAFQLLDSEIGAILTSTTVQATCDIAVVKASSPNVIEAEWRNLLLTGADIDSGQAVLRMSNESLYDEPYPADRMTKDRFPGLHR